MKEVKGMKICSTKNCIHKGKQQLKSNFYTNNKNSDKLCVQCKDCHRARLERKVKNDPNYWKNRYKKYENYNREYKSTGEFKERRKTLRKTNEYKERRSKYRRGRYKNDEEYRTNCLKICKKRYIEKQNNMCDDLFNDFLINIEERNETYTNS